MEIGASAPHRRDMFGANEHNSAIGDRNNLTQELENLIWQRAENESRRMHPICQRFIYGSGIECCCGPLGKPHFEPVVSLSRTMQLEIGNSKIAFDSGNAISQSEHVSNRDIAIVKGFNIIGPRLIARDQARNFLDRRSRDVPSALRISASFRLSGTSRPFAT